MTHFERLGLPGRFSVDLADLERAYLAASREVHPDFHHTGGGAPSQEAAALVNEAYQTLRDPVRRAEYLLASLGGPPASANATDPALMMEMMDARERAEDPAARPAVADELAAKASALVASLGPAFAATSPDLPAIRRTLNAIRTVRSLLREVSADLM